MSLLLQALKRAEETKRQRENAALEPVLAAEGNAPEVMEALSFPTLTEPLIEPVPSATTTVQTETHPDDLVFTQNNTPPETEPAPPVEPVREIISLEFESTTHTAPVAPVFVSAPVAPPEEPRMRAEPAPAAPAIEPVIITPAAPGAARQLLSAPRAKSARSTLPWLVLGGCVLLGGIGAWFWWQLQQLGTPTPSFPPAAPTTTEASAPSSMQDNASAPAALDSASHVASIHAVAKPARQTPAARQTALHPVPLARPSGNDAASYIEPQSIPAQLPQIERRTQEAAVPAPLEAAWQAYQKGDLATAETQYQRMLGMDARNRDAHLGLAAIAAQRGKKAEASSWYKKLLVLNPQDEEAHAGLAAVDTDSLSERAEARLLQQADRPESPRVLGQFYAARNRWHEAQEQYFIAFSREPNNADLAFNLAISLDHINQSKLAGDYYRKALALGRSSFDRKAVEQRLAEIVAGQK